MSVFPRAQLSMPADHRGYSVEHEDPTVRTEFEGGYVASRPRHKRTKLRRTFTQTYVNLTWQDKSVLEDFWNEVKGGATSFEWLDEVGFQSEFWRIKNDATHPDYDDELELEDFPEAPFKTRVRFVDKLRFARKGHGFNARFDLALKLEEV